MKHRLLLLFLICSLGVNLVLNPSRVKGVELAEAWLSDATGLRCVEINPRARVRDEV